MKSVHVLQPDLSLWQQLYNCPARALHEWAPETSKADPKVCYLPEAGCAVIVSVAVIVYFDLPKCCKMSIHTSPLVQYTAAVPSNAPGVAAYEAI